MVENCDDARLHAKVQSDCWAKLHVINTFSSEVSGISKIENSPPEKFYHELGTLHCIPEHCALSQACQSTPIGVNEAQKNI